MPSSACNITIRSEEHTSELQSHSHLVCRLLLEKIIKTLPSKGFRFIGLVQALDGPASHQRLVSSRARTRAAVSSAVYRIWWVCLFFFKWPAPTGAPPCPPPPGHAV